MTTVAPSCPISHSQLPVNPRGTPTRMPAIPIATDLPSLIRSVNIMRDILRNITTSLTVNNTYLPRQPRQPKVWGDRNYQVSPYPDWVQVAIDNEEGFVGTDPKQRAYVERLHTIIFRNNERDDDNLLKWQYRLPLTGRGIGPVESFREDFFERVVKVHWKRTEEPVPYAVTWFWQIEFHNTGTFPVDTGCTPWTMIEGDIGNILWPGDTTSAWGDPQFGAAQHDSSIIVSGAPTGTGAGSSGDHTLPFLGAVDGETYVIGENITGQITAQLMSEFKCWGSTTYPPPPIIPYWSAMCRTTQRLAEPTQIGTISIHAGGITARTQDGRPLDYVRTEMSLIPSVNGGAVTVTFVDNDPPPPPTP